MAAASRQSPRPYLAAPERRDHLLQVASRLVRKGGWGALSMQGLAAAAGVSRQLVYEHFATAEDLYLATLTQLFERAYATAEGITGSGRSRDEILRASIAQVMEMPVEERQALRALAAGGDPGRPGIARAHRRLRERIVRLWAPFVHFQTSLAENEAGAFAWMVTVAALALCDTVADGSMDRDRAANLFVQFVDGALATWQPKRPESLGTPHRRE